MNHTRAQAKRQARLLRAAVKFIEGGFDEFLLEECGGIWPFTTEQELKSGSARSCRALKRAFKGAKGRGNRNAVSLLNLLSDDSSLLELQDEIKDWLKGRVLTQTLARYSVWRDKLVGQFDDEGRRNIEWLLETAHLTDALELIKNGINQRSVFDVFFGMLRIHILSHRELGKRMSYDALVCEKEDLFNRLTKDVL
jgi:hypothetical protein